MKKYVNRLVWLGVFLWVNFICGDSVLVPEKRYQLEDYAPSSAGLLKLERDHYEQEQQLQVIKAVDTVIAGKNRTDKQPGASSLQAAKQYAHKKPVPFLVQELLAEQYRNELLQQTLVTVAFSDVSLHEAFTLLRTITGIPFVLDADVLGVVKDFSFKNTPLAGVLAVLLSNNAPQLALIKELGVWRVMRLEKAAALLTMVAEQQRRNDLVSAQVVMYHAAWNEEFKTRIERLWERMGNGNKERQDEYLYCDDHVKTLFFKGSNERVADFKHCLHAIDVALPQVKIEARIVLASKDFEEGLGFDWSGIYDRRASVNHMDFAGVGIGSVNTSDPASFSDLLSWSLNFIPTSLAGATNKIGLPLVFGNRTMETKRLNLLLNAAESRCEIKTILQPNLLVNSGERAELLVGQEMPHQVKMQESVQGAVTNAVTTSYKDVGIKMQVLPEVMPDKQSVVLEVLVENSTVASPKGVLKNPSTASSRGDYEYTIETARSKNKVQLKSGQTTQISGLVVNVEESFETGVPFLKDIPFLGVLFRGSRKGLVDKQVIIYITPTLIT